MDFFEKNITNRFKNASSHEGINADELWNKIEPEVSKKPSFYQLLLGKRNWLAMLSLFALLGSIAWYQLSEKSTDAISKDSNSKNQIQTNRQSETLIKNIESTVQFSTTPTNNNITDQSNNDLENTIQYPKNQTNTINNITSTKSNNDLETPLSANIQNQESQKVVSKQPLNDLLFSENLITTEENESNSSINEEKVILEENASFEKETISVQTPITTKQNEIEKQEEEIATVSLLEELPNLPSLALLLNEKKRNLDFNYSPSFYKKQNRLAIGIFTGTYIVKNKFSTNLIPDEERSNLLNKSFDYELGQSYSFEVSYRIFKNIHLRSGLEYLNSRSEFDIVQTWDTTMVNPNSPVASITDAKAIRTVVHHNKMKYFSIPIMLETQKRFGKSSIGISGGIGLNFIQSQTGKSINYLNNIDVYPSSENEYLPVSKFFLSYHLRPYFDYNINRNISVQLRVDLRYQQFGNSDFYGLNYYSLFGGLGIGIQNRF